MSNKKRMPAADSSVAGKSNSISNEKTKGKKKKKNKHNKRSHVSINYAKVFFIIILPLVLIVTGVFFVIQSVSLNVPSEIRSFSYSGRVEGEESAQKSAFNLQQQKVFVDSIKEKGSSKFSFYVNSEIKVDDNGDMTDILLGSPADNDCVIIATIFDGDGKIIYRSLGIEPGKEIVSASMFNKISYGTHNVKIAVNAYNKESYELIGTKYAKIKLLVGVE